MKRLTVATLLLLAVLVASLVVWLSSDSQMPRFNPARSQPAIGGVDGIYHDSLSPRPFEGGRLWVFVRKGTNDVRILLYDLAHKAILGELQNAQPVFMTQNGSKVLCVSRRGTRSVFQRTVQEIERLSGGKLRFGRRDDNVESFWIVDPRKSSAIRIGQVSQLAGSGSSFKPSPDSRYGYNKPSASFQKPEFFMCDLEEKKLTKIAIDGWPQGWWDTRSIILKTPAHDFILYNVATGSVTSLLSAGALADFFAKAGLDDASPATANLFTAWNGNEDEFYVTDTHKKWQAAESYLAKLQRPDATLKLLWPRFKFEWSDHLDPTRSYYLYSGRESGQASSAVFVRDLATGNVRTLVPDDGSTRFSVPAFNGNRVIYERSNALWQIDLTGANKLRLFPPPDREPEQRMNATPIGNKPNPVRSARENI